MTPIDECTRTPALIKAQKHYRMKRSQAVPIAEKSIEIKILKNITNKTKTQLPNIMQKQKTRKTSTR
jgi:hypothetical protein